MKSQVLFQVLFHALPLIPLAYGRTYLAIATVLGVCLPYIKVRKLTAILALERDGKMGSNEIAPKDNWKIPEIEKAISRWQFLTFLSTKSEKNNS